MQANRQPSVGQEEAVVSGIGHDLMLDGGWEKPLSVVLDWIDDRC